MLTRLGEDRGEQQRELEIALGGAPGATVGLGYLAEMPLWKASYRLVARVRLTACCRAGRSSRTPAARTGTMSRSR